MFGYYTSIVFIGILFNIIMCSILSSDEVIKHSNKKAFFLTFILLSLASLSEWGAVYLEVNNSSYHFFTTFLMSTVFFISPSTPLFLALSIDTGGNKFIKKIVYGNIIAVFLTAYSGLFTKKFFYYDSNNAYHRGDLFYYYFILILISVIVIFYNSYLIGKKYGYKNNSVLLLSLILLLSSVYAHFLVEDGYILWISQTIVVTLIYIYYKALMNQVDFLTNLFSRGCYENKLYDLKQSAVIINFDVNKFKQINDTYGHSYGDICLTSIGNTLKKVYGSYGLCYRIGGDEFSVILLKDLKRVEELNEIFTNTLKELNLNKEIPTVSVGYSNYIYKESNIIKVIEEADKMMYLKKKIS